MNDAKEETNEHMCATVTHVVFRNTLTVIHSPSMSPSVRLTKSCIMHQMPTKSQCNPASPDVDVDAVSCMRISPDDHAWRGREEPHTHSHSLFVATFLFSWQLMFCVFVVFVTTFLFSPQVGFWRQLVFLCLPKFFVFPFFFFPPFLFLFFPFS